MPRSLLVLLSVLALTASSHGQITEIQVGQSSGNPVLDLAAQRALVNTKTLAPLPAAYPAQRLGVQLEFEYFR